MAHISFQGHEEMLKELRKMRQEFGPLARAMIQAGGNAMADAWRETIRRRGLVDTGAMLAGVGTTKIKEGDNGLYIDVTSKGTDRTGTRNAEKAFVLNYGTSRLPATHWVEEAEQLGAPRSTAAMQAVLDAYKATGSIPKAETNDTYTATGSGRSRRRGRKK